MEFFYDSEVFFGEVSLRSCIVHMIHAGFFKLNCCFSYKKRLFEIEGIHFCPARIKNELDLAWFITGYGGFKHHLIISDVDFMFVRYQLPKAKFCGMEVTLNWYPPMPSICLDSCIFSFLIPSSISCWIICFCSSFKAWVITANN